MSISYKRSQQPHQSPNYLQNNLQNTHHKQYSFQSKYSPYKNPSLSNKGSEDQLEPYFENHYKNNYNTNHNSNSNSHPEESQNFISFQLKRQKERNRILQQRLKNKDIFIAQMKQLQQELSLAFDKSQEEVTYYKSICQSNSEEIHTLNISIRELKETLVQTEMECKKLAAQLDIANRKNNNKYSGHMITSVSQNRNRGISRQNSFQKLKSKKSRDESHDRQHQKQRQQYNSSNKKETSISQRDFNLQQESLSKKISKILEYSEEEINLEGKRIGKFLYYFFSMVASCNPDSKQPESLKQHLKFAWRWIKSIVKESISIKQKAKSYKQMDDALFKLLHIENNNEIINEVANIIKENKHCLKILKIVCDSNRIPPETSLKKIEQILKQRMK